MAPSTLAQWLGAVGTIAAVVVALFKDSILAWKRKPLLIVTCEKEIPCTVRTPIIVYEVPGRVLWAGNCYFVRAKVVNDGRTRAEKVQVSALKLSKRGPDSLYRYSYDPTAQSEMVE